MFMFTSHGSFFKIDVDFTILFFKYLEADALLMKQSHFGYHLSMSLTCLTMQ
jgi:hypothetical protein